MIELHYTGAREVLAEQTKPYTSLGGFIASTLVPNGRLSNLFGGVSELTKMNNRDEIIALAVKNIGDLAISDISIWFEYGETPAASLEIAVAAIDQSELYMEEVTSSQDLPYHASDFHLATEADPLIVSGSLSSKNYLGIWIKRRLTPIAEIACEAPTNEEVISVEDSISMKIDFTE